MLQWLYRVGSRHGQPQSIFHLQLSKCLSETAPHFSHFQDAKLRPGTRQQFGDRSSLHLTSLTFKAASFKGKAKVSRKYPLEPWCVEYGCAWSK